MNLIFTQISQGSRLIEAEGTKTPAESEVPHDRQKPPVPAMINLRSFPL
ncbi:hypothetical protein [Neobacillus notoginsengisoli]|nr:hypothetical protein [Neobacillus notoginsengisoli]